MRSIPDHDDNAEVADLLGSIARRLRRATNRDLDPLGVTASQVRALRAVARSGEPTRMRDLADRLGIARRSATSVVEDLVQRGMVERHDDPHDGRGVVVTVTPAGRALLATLRRRRLAATSELTAELSADELTTLRDLLARLVVSASDLTGRQVDR